MKLRNLISLAALGAFLFAGTVALALDKKKPTTATRAYQGKVVSTSASKLLISNKDGKKHEYQMSAQTKILINGKQGRFSDLKPGMEVRITTPKNSDNALRVEVVQRK